MNNTLPTSTSGLRAEHPLAGLRRPVPLSVIIVIGVLPHFGWTAEQVLALAAVLLPAGAAVEARA